MLFVGSVLRVLAWLAPWPYIHDINEKNAGLAEFIFWIIAIWGSISVFGKFNKGLYHILNNLFSIMDSN